MSVKCFPFPLKYFPQAIPWGSPLISQDNPVRQIALKFAHLDTIWMKLQEKKETKRNERDKKSKEEKHTYLRRILFVVDSCSKRNSAKSASNNFSASSVRF